MKKVAVILSGCGVFDGSEIHAVSDYTHKVVSTPAYMLATRISEVFTGVSALVKDVLEMAVTKAS